MKTSETLIVDEQRRAITAHFVFSQMEGELTRQGGRGGGKASTHEIVLRSLIGQKEKSAAAASTTSAARTLW